MGIQQGAGIQDSDNLRQICTLGKWDVVSREVRLQQRRTDAEEHHHKQIWTKDPHGGPYKKVCLEV